MNKLTKEEEDKLNTDHQAWFFKQCDTHTDPMPENYEIEEEEAVEEAPESVNDQVAQILTNVLEERKVPLGSKGSVKIDYTNWEGKRGWRWIEPLSIRYDSTKWHPEKQWLLHAYDTEKKEYRDFAMAEITCWTNEVPKKEEDSNDDEVTERLKAGKTVLSSFDEDRKALLLELKLYLEDKPFNDLRFEYLNNPFTTPQQKILVIIQASPLFDTVDLLQTFSSPFRVFRVTKPHDCEKTFHLEPIYFDDVERLAKHKAFQTATQEATVRTNACGFDPFSTLPWSVATNHAKKEEAIVRTTEERTWSEYYNDILKTRELTEQEKWERFTRTHFNYTGPGPDTAYTPSEIRDRAQCKVTQVLPIEAFDVTKIVTRKGGNYDTNAWRGRAPNLIILQSQFPETTSMLHVVILPSLLVDDCSVLMDHILYTKECRMTQEAAEKAMYMLLRNPRAWHKSNCKECKNFSNVYWSGRLYRVCPHDFEQIA